MRVLQQPANPDGPGAVPPVVVAHRGYAANYPENTLPAIRAALEAGACWVEFDVHSSADGVPVVVHDESLERTAGLEALVTELTWEELAGISVHEPERLGETFRGMPIPALYQAVALLGAWPGRSAFVELKRKSLARFGHELFIQQVLRDLGALLERCVPISFDRQAVAMCRDCGASRVGWVLPEWSEDNRRLADALQPAFLFCDYRRVPDGETLWEGAWEWVLYDIETADLAVDLCRRGAGYVETMDPGELLADTRLARGACHGR